MRYLLYLLCLASCGYDYVDRSEAISVVVPYVIGDFEGKMTEQLIRTLSTSTPFQITRSTGRYQIRVRLDSDTMEKIGYRFDRKDRTGELENNLLRSEGRRTVVAEVQVFDTLLNHVVVEPYTVWADAEYDFVNPNSICDVSFITTQGCRESTIDFSLGQLDSVDSAEDNALRPLFCALSQRIVDSLILHLNEL